MKTYMVELQYSRPGDSKNSFSAVYIVADDEEGAKKGARDWLYGLGRTPKEFTHWDVTCLIGDITPGTVITFQDR